MTTDNNIPGYLAPQACSARLSSTSYLFLVLCTLAKGGALTISLAKMLTTIFYQFCRDKIDGTRIYSQRKDSELYSPAMIKAFKLCVSEIHFS